MRRKSERTATKKKSSPDKKEKVEKAKRRGTRRNRKHSSSSESGSAEDNTPKETGEVSQKEAIPPKSVKEDSPEESQEQVWHVKATETSGDVGEIKKLKICLARPPSTPERADRSPRSKRKHSRATSSSDTQSIEGEEKKKSKHRSKRLTESKEAAETSKEDHDEVDVQPLAPPAAEPESTNTTTEVESAESNKVVTDETPMSTTYEENKNEKVESTESKESEVSHENVPKANEEEKQSEPNKQEKPSDADTTVVSPKPAEDSEETVSSSPKKRSPERKRSISAEKSEILELHAEESKCESSEISMTESQEIESKSELDQEKDNSIILASGDKVSNNENSNELSGNTESNSEDPITTNQNDVVESTQVSVQSEKETMNSTDSVNEGASKDNEKINEDKKVDVDNKQNTEISNEQGTPIVINRKRRWGTRPSKLSTQKSITISTDVLKEIIPDVKPAEFDEVIEEKKHKRVEMHERIDRPVLPKIIIDNTEHIEVNNKDQKTETGDKENVKLKETNLASTRKISIVKDNDSIITRPPSPPRHKQSSILYITNLVRPFTLPQLKNLLQRTGRLVENGVWMDSIKSKCFVKYEREDQAVETRHALHGVTWPVSNPKTLHVDFSTQEDFDKAIANEDTDNAQHSTIPGTVEDWLREQDMKRERGELEKPWERKAAMREWDVGKNDKTKEPIRQDKMFREERPPLEKRRHRTPERSPEPARKFKKKEDEAPAKLLDDLFKKTKSTPCIYWLPLSAETIAVKEEQRRQHMAEHERRLQELRRTHRRH